MVKLGIYKCDRCCKEFKREEKDSPSNLEVNDEDFNLEVVDKQLCENCMASFWVWFTYDEEFDKLANEISRKETGEE